MSMAFPYFTVFGLLAAFSPYFPVMLFRLGYSASTVGIFLGINQVAGIAGPFIFGHFADKTGMYKPPLAAAIILFIIALYPLTLFTQPLFTGIVVLIMSLGLCSILPLEESVTSIIVGSTGNYGKIRVSGSIAWILVSLLLQFTPVLKPSSSLNVVIWSALFGLLALVSVFCIPPSYTNVRKSRPQNSNEPAAAKTPGLFTPLLVMGLLMMFWRSITMSCLNFVNPFLIQELNWEAIGLVSSIGALAEIPCFFIAKKCINRFGAINVLAVGTLGTILRFAILAAFPYRWGVVLCQSLHSVSFGLFHPAALVFIANCVPPERRAFGISLYMALGTALPSLLGNVAGGYIVEYFGYRSLFGVYSLFPLISLALYFVIRFQRKR